MTSSGTFNFGLSNSSIILEAYDRIGIRPSQISREQMSSGIRSLNLELQSWSNMPPNLWAVSLVSFTLTQGVPTYTFDTSVDLVLDAYVTLVQAGQDNIDRILVSISRSEYASYADKEQQGAPSVFWFNRILPAPTITLYQVPDGVSETTLNCYVMKRVQDATFNNGETPNIPNRFLDALCARVATRLSVKYAQDKYMIMKSISDEAFTLATKEDHERAALSISPVFGSYYS